VPDLCPDHVGCEQQSPVNQTVPKLGNRKVRRKRTGSTLCPPTGRCNQPRIRRIAISRRAQRWAQLRDCPKRSVQEIYDAIQRRCLNIRELGVVPGGELNPQCTKYRRILSTQKGSEPFGEFSTVPYFATAHKRTMFIALELICSNLNIELLQFYYSTESGAVLRMAGGDRWPQKGDSWAPLYCRPLDTGCCRLRAPNKTGKGARGFPGAQSVAHLATKAAVWRGIQGMRPAIRP
jgi:hypothetical protein